MASKPKDYIAGKAQGSRRAQGLDTAEIAERMRQRGHDWTESTVTNIENGRKSRWSLLEMWDYADVLGLDPLDLFPLDRLDDATIRSALPGLLDELTLTPASAPAPLSLKAS